MMWRVFKAVNPLWQVLDDRVQSLSRISREDPDELLEGSDLSDAERRAALKREARRRREKEQ